MSLGFVGHCKKKSEDENGVFYAYSGANWNIPRDRNADEAYDGEFFISKSVLAWERNKTKQYEHIEWVSKSIKTGNTVIVKPCKNSFKRIGSIDYIAYCCLLKVFKHIYNDGIFPEKECFIQ